MTDYIKNEKKLLQTQLKLVGKIKQIEALSKIDEFVGRAHVKTIEKLGVSVKTVESLSADISLPLKVKGRMLGVGRHKNKYYTVEELKNSIELYKNSKYKIPIKVDHRMKEVDSTIGVVDTIYWNEVEQAVMFEGHINNENHARNIKDGAITEVSASIQSFDDYNVIYGVIGCEPEYVELSVVTRGAYIGNSIEVA